MTQPLIPPSPSVQDYAAQLAANADETMFERGDPFALFVEWLEAAKASPFTLPETEARKSQVWLVGFGDSSLNFELLVWPTQEAVKRPAAMHAAYTWLIADALDAAGVEVPVPQTDLHVRTAFGLEGDEALQRLGYGVGGPPRATPGARRG